MAVMNIHMDRPGVPPVYSSSETVKGVVTVQSPSALSVSVLSLRAEGTVALQLSPKAVGIFEAFHNTVKPLKVFAVEIPLVTEEKFPEGMTEIPFEFELKVPPGSVGFLETYHGVFVDVQYQVVADLQRGMFAKNLSCTKAFAVRNPGQAYKPEFDTLKDPLPFVLEPTTLRNVRKTNLPHVPQFKITGQLDAYQCDISKPLTGYLKLESCSQKIKSIELQLVRVEYCAAQEAVAKEATEIQNIQIADGNVVVGLDIPLYMVFPRWFTCPTLVVNNFKVDFEVNLVVLLEDNHQITENFPIKLYRRHDDIEEYAPNQ
ncbi:Down syndrome critical region protein 3-like protein [Diplonema papillatum]|nr:Down syndrome critical region protein 3-like protein [Diplonema papillatum]